MLYRLEFATNNLSLPFGYHTKVQGLIYAMLRDTPEYSGFLHNEGYHGQGGHRFKLFCFSELEGGQIRRGQGLLFPEHMSFQIRSADPNFAAVLEQSVQQGGGTYQLDGQIIRLVKLRRDNLDITGSQLRIKMVSPMTVYTKLENGKTVYYDPLDLPFQSMMQQNFQKKWLAATGEETTEKIEIYTLAVGSGDKCVTKIKGIYVTAWGGSYLLKAKPEVLKFLYHTGLGSKNSMGFGMFDIENRVRKTESGR